MARCRTWRGSDASFKAEAKWNRVVRTLADTVKEKFYHVSTCDEATKSNLSATATVTIAGRFSISTTSLPSNLAPAELETKPWSKAVHSSSPSISGSRAEGVSRTRHAGQVHEEEQHVPKQLPRGQQQSARFKKTCISLPTNKPQTSRIPKAW